MPRLASLDDITEAYENTALSTGSGLSSKGSQPSPPGIAPEPFYADLAQNGKGGVQVNFGYGYDITVNGSFYITNVSQTSNLSPTTLQNLPNILAQVTAISQQYHENTTPAGLVAANAQLATLDTTLLDPTQNWQSLAVNTTNDYYNNVVVNKLQGILGTNQDGQDIFTNLPNSTQWVLEYSYYNSPDILGPRSYTDVKIGDLVGLAEELGFDATAPLNNQAGAELGYLADAALALGGIPTTGPVVIVTGTVTRTVTQITSVDFTASKTPDLYNFLAGIFSGLNIGHGLANPNSNPPSKGSADSTTAQAYIAAWNSPNIVTPSFNVLTSSIETELIKRGYYVVQPNDTYSSIAILVNNSQVTPRMLATLNGDANSSVAVPAGTILLVPISIQEVIMPLRVVPGTTVGVLDGSGVAYYYDTATGDLITTAANPDGSNVDTITILNASGGTIWQIPAGSASQIALNSTNAVFTFANNVSLTQNVDGSLSLPFPGRTISVPSGDTLQFTAIGDPTFLIDIENPTAGASEEISYAPDGTDILTNFAGLDDSDGITSQDIENANGTSIITTDNDSDYTTTDYSGPDGSGSVIDPPSSSQYLTYVWQAGNGDFSTPVNWDVLDYDPVNYPWEPIPDAPGDDSLVTFDTAGTITGMGQAGVIYADADLTFIGSFTSQEVSNSGNLSIQGTCITNIANTGNLTIGGEVIAEDDPLSYLADGGTLSISNGGYADVANVFELGDGSVQAGGTLAGGLIYVSGGGTLTVNGNDALLLGDPVIGDDTQDIAGGLYGAPGTGNLIISNNGQLSANSVTVGESIDGQESFYDGSWTIESGGTGVVVGSLWINLSSSVVVDGAGSQLSAGTVFFDSLSSTGASLSVLDGAALTAQVFMGFGNTQTNTSNFLIDGSGSSLNADGVLYVNSGAMTVSDSAFVSLGEDLISTEIVPDEILTSTVGSGGTGSLVIESGGEVSEDDAPDANNSMMVLGASSGDQGLIIVTDADSTLNLGDVQLIVGNGGSGTLGINGGGTVIAGEIDLGAGQPIDGQVNNSQGTIIVQGTSSLLFGTTLEVGGTTGDGAGGTGTLTIQDGGIVSVSVAQVWGSGLITLSGGELDTDPMTISAGGMSSGNGVITGDITNAGTIEATGGTLELTDEISGTGTLMIAAGSELLLDGTIDAGVIIDFTSGGTGTLALSDPADMQGTIEGQAPGDQIIDVPCYVTGTHLATAAGTIPVEALNVGDLVQSQFAGLVPVTWNGHRRVDCRRHPKPEDIWPVRVLTHAFGRGLPHRDLWLSPDHSVFINDVLIPIRYLINGRTIVQEPRDAVTYWHVELARHDVLLAEGLPCESFLDTGNRGAFENGGGAVQLHPDFALRIWETQACAPLVLSGAKLEGARSFLLQQAEHLGYATTRDPGLEVLADGCALPSQTDGRRLRVQLPPSAERVRVISRICTPAHTIPNAEDMRQLGVAICRIWLDGREVSLESEGLASGWHAPEPGWRWTDGDAALSLGGVRELAFEVAMTGTYWHDTETGTMIAAGAVSCSRPHKMVLLSYGNG